MRNLDGTGPVTGRGGRCADRGGRGTREVIGGVREEGDGKWHDGWYGAACAVRGAVPQELSLFGSLSHVLSSSHSACEV